MVKSPCQREENGSLSPCQIEKPLGIKKSIPGSPSEDYFTDWRIKNEPHDEHSVDPFDELAELLEQENVPVYLVDMPLVAPPPPSISLPDDCFLFGRRSKVEIGSPVPSSPSSISELLPQGSPKQSETVLEPMVKVHQDSRRSSVSSPNKQFRRRRSRSGSSKRRQCSPVRNISGHKGDETTSSRDGAHRNSSSMETKRSNRSRAKSPGQIKRERVPRKSASRTSTDSNRDRTRRSNRTCSGDRKQMSYMRRMRRQLDEKRNVFGRRRSRSGSSNRRHRRRDSLSPIRSRHISRQEFPRHTRRYSPNRLSRRRCLSRAPTKSPSRSRSRLRCRSRHQTRRHSRSRSRQRCRSRQQTRRHSRSRSRQHCLSREPPKRHSRSKSQSAVNDTTKTATVSPVCSAEPVEILQPSDCILPCLGPATPIRTHNSPRPILPIISNRFENPGPPPHKHFPQMPLAVASNHMWYTQTHYTHFEYNTTTMPDSAHWQAPAPVYNYGGEPPPALGPHDLRHRLGSVRSLPLGPHDLRHRIQGRPEYNSLATEQEHMAPPYNSATFSQTGYPSQYYPNGYY